jgi:hypothetical protein
VTTTVWLASYPKSGNTWVRLLLANLAAGADGPADINDLPERGNIASARGLFDSQLLIESGLLTHEEADNLRPRVYELISGGGAIDDEGEELGSVRFMKAHDAYVTTGKGEPLLAGARGAVGAIVIVRDPRDIVPSLASHMSLDLDQAIEFMGSPEATFCGTRSGQPNQLRQRLLDWSGHVASWLDQADIPTHLIRYEDLLADTARELAGALAFAGREATAAEIDRAVAFSSFSELRRQEGERGFREAPRPHAPRDFFRRGETGAWRSDLSPEQATRLQTRHGAMMRQLGYDLAAPRIAQPT